MLKIDGSYGEGGGQILRYGTALSILNDAPIEIYNIRKNRSKPGMRNQHYTAVKIMKNICNAKTEGLYIGSNKLIFEPGKIKPGKYSFDIKTAGSITLVFQACILSCLNSKKPVSIVCEGGTDVKWSPSWDYFENIFIPMLKKMGIDIEAKLIERGYYPRGGGKAHIKIFPVKRITPLNLDFKPNFEQVYGLINIGDLPDHINKRLKHTAVKQLLNQGLKSAVRTHRCNPLSPGVGITLWSDIDKTIVGSCALGEKGVTSEELGKQVANRFLQEIKSDCTLDIYLFDQLLPYMAIATEIGSSNCWIRETSNHAYTSMWLIKQFLDVSFKQFVNEKNIKMEIHA